jgi:hypothetical protein
LDLVSVNYLANAWVNCSTIFWWLFGGDWRKVPLDDQCRSSLKMATMAAIFDLVSIDSLTDPRDDWSDIFVGYWE